MRRDCLLELQALAVGNDPAAPLALSPLRRDVSYAYNCGTARRRGDTAFTQAGSETAPAARIAICSRLIRERVTATNEQQAQTFVSRAWAFVILNKFADARADYDRALQIAPGFYIALNKRALFLLRTKQANAALIDYNAAVAVGACNHRTPCALSARFFARIN